VDGQRRDSHEGGGGQGQRTRQNILPPHVPWYGWLLWLLASCAFPCLAGATAIESPVLTSAPVPGACRVPFALTTSILTGSNRAGRMDAGAPDAVADDADGRSVGRGEMRAESGPSGDATGTLSGKPPLGVSTHALPVHALPSGVVPTTAPPNGRLKSTQDTEVQSFEANSTDDFLAQDSQISLWIRLRDVRVGDT